MQSSKFIALCVVAVSLLLSSVSAAPTPQFGGIAGGPDDNGVVPGLLGGVRDLLVGNEDTTTASFDGFGGYPYAGGYPGGYYSGGGGYYSGGYPYGGSYYF